MTTPAENFWTSLPLGREVRLVARDGNGLAAFNKPAGVLSHPNEPGDEPRCLLDARYHPDGEFFSWPANDSAIAAAAGATRPAGRLWLLNRLDSATSGLILAASSEALALEIRALFKKRHIKKIYHALVFGVPSEREQTWRDRLAVDKRGDRIRTTAAGHIPSEAHMRVLRQRRAADGQPSLALIELEPKTGRSHQLRVQCAKRRLPIVGDATYGDFRANRDYAKATRHKRMFLHSLTTEFNYTFAGQTHRFAATAPPPTEFDAAF